MSSTAGWWILGELLGCRWPGGPLAALPLSLEGDRQTQPVFSIVLGGVWERLFARRAGVENAPEAVLRLEMEDAGPLAAAN